MNTIQSKEDRLSGMVKSIHTYYNRKVRLGFHRLFAGLIAIFLFALLPVIALAQGNPDSHIDMADAMRASGKIYVVILVIGIVFTGLFVFAIRTDSKIAKLEKEVKSLKISEES